MIRLIRTATTPGRVQRMNKENPQPAGTVTSSGPGLLFAAMIASRSEQSPSQVPSLVSAVFVTTKVAACAAVAATTSRIVRRVRTGDPRFCSPHSQHDYEPADTEPQ